MKPLGIANKTSKRHEAAIFQRKHSRHAFVGASAVALAPNDIAVQIQAQQPNVSAWETSPVIPRMPSGTLQIAVRAVRSPYADIAVFKVDKP